MWPKFVEIHQTLFSKFYLYQDLNELNMKMLFTM